MKTISFSTEDRKKHQVFVDKISYIKEAKEIGTDIHLVCGSVLNTALSISQVGKLFDTES